MNNRIWRYGLVAAAVAVVALVGFALLTGRDSGAQLTPNPTPSTGPGTTLGSLAYGVYGDIYVADWDGGNPVRIANGHPGGNGCGPAGYTGAGTIWSPDGRYLAYREGFDQSCRDHHASGTVDISDPQGHLVASFPGDGWLISWSPDSTRVATWVRLWRTIGIYGLDGVREKLLTLPRGLMAPGDFDPVWSPDGASLLVPHGVEIPIDGRTPRQLPADDPRSHWLVTYSPDGAHVAYTSGWAAPLVVAAADGSQARELVSSGGLENAVWSPTGDRIAFDALTGGEILGAPATDLRVVDVASGTVTSLTASGAAEHVIRFSPDGDRILFSRTNTNDVASLWSIRADGSEPRLLVTGTGWGEWQSLSPTR
jgi:Periplasmic component of the Tol biopolymer transport system